MSYNTLQDALNALTLTPDPDSLLAGELRHDDINTISKIQQRQIRTT